MLGELFVSSFLTPVCPHLQVNNVPIITLLTTLINIECTGMSLYYTRFFFFTLTVLYKTYLSMGRPRTP